MGAKVIEIYRVIKFKQDYKFRDYIQNKTDKRGTAKRKWMNYSLYERMRMNPPNFIEPKFLHNHEEMIIT